MNQDEVLDVELALGALGGIRHSSACDAAERSTRRFDERNHRLHESRMKELGMEGEEKPEADDMSHQVLIRSPITHHHYPPKDITQSTSPTQSTRGLSNLAKVAIVAGMLGGPIGGGLAGYYLSKPGTTTTINNAGDTTGIGLLPPSPPNK